MMYRILVLLAVLNLSGCTITISPIPSQHLTKQPTKQKKISRSTHPSPNSWLIVDSNWLVQYRMLEDLHGNYVLGDDQKVEAVGGGKYKVTHAMMDHFRDLSQTPVPSPTP